MQPSNGLESVISEVKAAARIEEVVGRYVTLKRAGVSLKGKCPFHDERSASFSVFPSPKDTFKCFGCGVHGDVIEFVKRINNVEFIDALRMLAHDYNIPMPGNNQPPVIIAPEIKTAKADPDHQPGDYGFGEVMPFDAKDIELWFGKQVIIRHQEMGKDVDKGNPLKYVEILSSILKSLNWVKVSSYFRINDNLEKKIFNATDLCPIYVRREKEGNLEFAKVYTPEVTDKTYKFSYLGHKPKDFVNGLQQLQKERAVLYENAYAEAKKKLNVDEGASAEEREAAEKSAKDAADKQKLEDVIIVCGERDAANAKAMGFFPVWLNSESAIISKKKLLSLQICALNIYYCGDLDDTGKNQAHKLSMHDEHDLYLEIKHIILPPELRTKRTRKGGYGKDLRDYCDHYNVSHFRKALRVALPYRFWEEVMNNKGDKRVSANGTALMQFLENNGFYKYEVNATTQEYMFIHVKGHVVTEIDGSKIKQFVLDWLRRRMINNKVLNMVMYGSALSATGYENLRMIALDFKDHGPDYQFLFFRNETWKVTAQGTEVLKSHKFDKYVWSDKVLQYDVTAYKEPLFEAIVNGPGDYDLKVSERAKSGFFFKYLWNTCRVHWRKEEQENLPLTEEEQKEERLHLMNKLFAFGYMLHRYKFSFRSWFVYAMEHALTKEGESQGGTGKSIFFKALAFMRKMETINGRDRKVLENPHAMENVTRFTDFLYFDEMSEYFPFNKYFSHITGDITVNPKGKKQHTIRFEESPKVGGSSNYALKNVDGSTDRRLLFISFSDYYHSANMRTGEPERNVRDDLGIELFIDFSRKDWDDFFNLAAASIQLYLQYPTGEKISPPGNNIHEKNILANIGESFLDWAETMFYEQSPYINCYIVREQMFQSYVDKTKNKITAQAFKGKLQTYCQYKGHILNPEAVQQKDGRVIKTISGVPKEAFYIQTFVDGALKPIEDRTQFIDHRAEFRETIEPDPAQPTPF